MRAHAPRHPHPQVESLVRKVIHEPIKLTDHPHIGAAEEEFITSFLQRKPDERLGSRATGGNAAVIAHPWFRGITARQFLTKQVVWVPAEPPCTLPTQCMLLPVPSPPYHAMWAKEEKGPLLP